MNVTFRIKDVDQLARLVDIHITSWRVYYGDSPFTGSYGDWSASPGPTGPDQPQTAYFGTQRYVRIEYSGPEGHGTVGCSPQDFLAGITYTVSVVTGAIDTGTGQGGIYTLTYSAGYGGSISGQATQVVQPGGSGTLVTAVPLPGYHFERWSDGVRSAARKDSDLYSDFYCQAVFTANTLPGGGGSPPGPKPLSVPVIIGGLTLLGLVFVSKRRGVKVK